MRPVIISLLFSVFLASLIGVWVGKFETFGGVHRKQAFDVVVWAIGVTSGVFIITKFKVRKWFILGALLVVVFTYEAHVLAGMAWYCEPSGWIDFWELYGCAFNGDL